MTPDEAMAAMVEARRRRAEAVYAVEQLFMAHRTQIQAQCPHEAPHGRLLNPNRTVAVEWCATCDFEFPKNSNMEIGNK